MSTPFASREPETPDADERAGTMGFLDHLEELRSRSIRSRIAVAAGMAVAFLFHDRIAAIVLAPTALALDKKRHALPWSLAVAVASEVTTPAQTPLSMAFSPRLRGFVAYGPLAWGFHSVFGSAGWPA